MGEDVLKEVPKRLLLIFAHPDDESFAMGGTIAKYAAQGVEIMLVVATRGEEGKTGGLCVPEDLGSFREQELRQAAAILGIKTIEFLGYRDKEVPNAAPLKITEQLTRIIRAFRPQVVITFAEDGASGHRDHRAIHHFAKSSIRLAAEEIEPEWGKAYQVSRVCYVQPGWRMAKEQRETIAYKIGIREFADQKWQAICAHKTQIFSRQRFESLPEAEKKNYLSEEYFLCDEKLSNVPGRGDDLFQGI